jgi:hypothetical protein
MIAVLVTPAFAADPNPGTGSADVTVMNADTAASSTVVAQYYNQDGTLAGSRNVNLAALGSAQLRAADAGLPDSWKGSMVLSSTTELASVATIQWSGNPLGDGIEADSYSGFVAGAIRMNMPFAVYAPNAQYTVFSIQNTENVVANITMKYYNRDGVLDFTITDSIPINGQKMYDLHTPGPKIPVWANSSYYTTKGNWTGALLIETGGADQKVAAVGNNFWPRYSVAYNGSSEGATKVFIPSVERRNTNGGDPWLGHTVIAVQNLGGSATNLTLRFVNANTGLVDLTIGPIAVAANAAKGFNTRAGGDVPASTFNVLGNSWVGSAIVESDSQQVAAISYSLRPRDNESGSATGASLVNAGNSTFLPEIYQIGPAGAGRTQWSLLRLQSVTTSQATVTMKFYNRDGTEVVAARQDFTIDGEKSKNFNLKGDTPINLGTNWSGAIYITSNQPLAVVVETLWGLQKLAAYNGYSK